MKVTKKAKDIELKDIYIEKKLVYKWSNYVCRCCGSTIYQGMDKNVTAFICDCGQHYKIKNRINIIEV